MTEFQFYESEDNERSAWGDAVAETAPELIPERLPPEFSSEPCLGLLVQRKRQRLNVTS